MHNETENAKSFCDLFGVFFGLAYVLLAIFCDDPSCDIAKIVIAFVAALSYLIKFIIILKNEYKADYCIILVGTYTFIGLYVIFR